MLLPYFHAKPLLVRTLLLLCSLALAVQASAQAVTQPVSARYLGVFAYSDQQGDAFAARVNPASLAGLQQSQAGAYAERRFMLQDLNLFQGAVALRTNSGTFGLHAGYFGFSQSNQSALSLSYGRRVGKIIDVGASFHYQQLSQASIYGSANAITGSAGILLHLGSRVHAGASVYNPIRASWGGTQEERLPMRYGFGLGMDVSDQLFLGTEIIKEENLPIDVQAAIHYRFLPQFFVRAGVATQTSNLFAALGFNLPAFRIDIATSYHQQLGWSPGVLLLARFGKSKPDTQAPKP